MLFFWTLTLSINRLYTASEEIIWNPHTKKSIFCWKTELELIFFLKNYREIWCFVILKKKQLATNFTHKKTRLDTDNFINWNITFNASGCQQFQSWNSCLFLFFDFHQNRQLDEQLNVFISLCNLPVNMSSFEIDRYPKTSNKSRPPIIPECLIIPVFWNFYYINPFNLGESRVRAVTRWSCVI